MKKIAAKIVLFFILCFTLWNFLWVVSVFYLMGNSPGQIIFYSKVSIILWITYLIIGVAVIYYSIKKVDNMIVILTENKELDIEELKKTSILSLNYSFIGFFIYSTIWILCSLSFFIILMINKIGINGSISVFVGGIAGLLTCPIIFFGILGVIMQYPNRLFALELNKRNIYTRGFYLSIKVKFSITLLLIALGFCTWLGGLGYYTGLNQTIKEIIKNEKDYQNIFIDYLKNSNANIIDDNTINNIRDKIDQEKDFFIADAAGNILKSSTEKIYLDNNDFFNNILKEKFPLNEKFSFYENFNERVITVSPVNGSLYFGTVHYIGNRMSRFIDFYIWLFVFILAGIIVSMSIAVSLALMTTGSIMNILQNISKGDISTRIGKDCEDDFGQVITDYNNFMNTINDLVVLIKKSVLSSKDLSANLASSTEEASASLEEIRATIESIKNKTSILDDEIGNSRKHSIDIKNFSLNVLSQADDQAANITEGSASVEEVISSIKNITKNVEEKMELVNNLENMAADGKKEMEESVNIIKKVTEFASIIMDTVAVINNISSQTNLLAMNASIEAAHAGETGRGFSVVAAEIRKLAEETGRNAKNISDSLKKLIDNIFISEEKTNLTSSHFKNIYSGIKELTDSLLETKNSMQELSIISNQITEILSSLINSSTSVKESSDKMVEMTQVINDSMGNINNISNDTNNSLIEFSQSIKEIHQSILIITEAGQKNLENINKLDDLTSKFLTSQEDI